MIKWNFNTLLLVLGGLGVFAPDVAFIAVWLAHQNVAWLIPVSKIFGFLAAAFAAAPLAVPKLRAFLALLGLATPAGSVVPAPSTPAPPKDPAATSPPVRKDSGVTLVGGMGIWLLIAVVVVLICFLVKSARADEALPSTTPTAVQVAPVVMPVLPDIKPIVPASNPATVAASAPVTEAQPTAPSKPEEPKWTMLGHDSKYGACKGNFCLAPALALQAFQYVPSTGDMTGGVTFSGGYGVVWHTLVDLGFAIYGGVQFSRDKPFTAQGIGMFSVANYFAFGPGFQMLGQPSGPAKFQLIVCFAANWIPGLVSKSG